jgi:hypothetical protein
MEQEIVKLDKPYRRRLFTAYLLCLAAVGIALYLGLPAYFTYIKSANFQDSLTVSELSIIGLLVPLVGPSFYLMATGRRIIRSKRMPYPGQKVIHDTRVVEGKKAVVRGRILFYLGVACIVLVAAGIGRSVYLIEKFRHFNPFKAWKEQSRIVSSEQPGYL